MHKLNCIKLHYSKTIYVQNFMGKYFFASKAIELVNDAIIRSRSNCWPWVKKIFAVTSWQDGNYSHGNGLHRCIVRAPISGGWTIDRADPGFFRFLYCNTFANFLAQIHNIMYWKTFTVFTWRFSVLSMYETNQSKIVSYTAKNINSYLYWKFENIFWSWSKASLWIYCAATVVGTSRYLIT